MLATDRILKRVPTARRIWATTISLCFDGIAHLKIIDVCCPQQNARDHEMDHGRKQGSDAVEHSDIVVFILRRAVGTRFKIRSVSQASSGQAVTLAQAILVATPWIPAFLMPDRDPP